MSAQPFTDKIRDLNPELFRKFVQACDRERLTNRWHSRPLTDAERVRVEEATTFEMVNANGRGRRVLKFKGSRRAER